jgi:hypothetical protein
MIAVCCTAYAGACMLLILFHTTHMVLPTSTTYKLVQHIVRAPMYLLAIAWELKEWLRYNLHAVGQWLITQMELLEQWLVIQLELLGPRLIALWTWLIPHVQTLMGHIRDIVLFVYEWIAPLLNTVWILLRKILTVLCDTIDWLLYKWRQFCEYCRHVCFCVLSRIAALGAWIGSGLQYIYDYTLGVLFGMMKRAFDWIMQCMRKGWWYVQSKMIALRTWLYNHTLGVLVMLADRVYQALEIVALYLNDKLASVCKWIEHGLVWVCHQVYTVMVWMAQCWNDLVALIVDAISWLYDHTLGVFIAGLDRFMRWVGTAIGQFIDAIWPSLVVCFDECCATVRWLASGAWYYLCIAARWIWHKGTVCWYAVRGWVTQVYTIVRDQVIQTWSIVIAPLYQLWDSIKAVMASIWVECCVVISHIKATVYQTMADTHAAFVHTRDACWTAFIDIQVNLWSTMDLVRASLRGRSPIKDSTAPQTE